MRALASGPLGVLVMVAPLVAIPVLSTFGIPQFAPLVASPVEPDGEPDVITASVDDPPVDLGAAASTTTGSRSADDLFAPLESPSPEDRAASDGDLPGDTPGLEPLVPPVERSGSRNGSRSAPVRSRDRALDDWIVVPESNPPEQAGRRLPEGFEPEDGSSSKAVRPELPRNGDMPLPGMADPSSGELTWKEAQKQLNDLGIRSFTLVSMDDGQFQFRCLVSDPASPSVDRWITVMADEPLMAVQKALVEIHDLKASL